MVPKPHNIPIRETANWGGIMSPIDTLGKYTRPIVSISAVMGLLGFLYSTNAFYQSIDRTVDSKVVKALEQAAEKLSMKAEMERANLTARVSHYHQEVSSNRKSVEETRKEISEIKNNVSEISGDVKAIKTDISYLKRTLDN